MSKLSLPSSRGQGRARLHSSALNRLLAASTRREEMHSLVSELASYQAALEMQNEELRIVQQELAESRDRYFELYELAPVSYLTLDEHGTIVESNLGLAGLISRPRRDLIGRPFAAFLVPEYADLLHLQLRRVFLEGRRINVELALRRADGSLRLVRLDAVPSEVGGIAPAQCRAVLTDVHELKEAESYIRVLNGELAGHIDELTGKNQQIQVESADRLALSAVLTRSQDKLRQLSRQIITSQEAERRRIARELHDETGQSLGAIIAELRAVEDQCRDESARPAIRRVRERATVALRDVRHIAHDLHPSALASCGLVPALNRFFADQQRLHHLAIDTQLGGLAADERLVPVVELTLFRVVQEAFNNIVKHAGAERVTVVLVKHGGRLRLVVEDDGRGFESDAADARPGLGLVGMRERVGLIGGTMQVESIPERGTTLVVSIPMEPEYGTDPDSHRG